MSEETPAPDVRDRIVEFRRVPAAELVANEKNWRTHPHAQTAALREVLSRVGIADAVIAYHSERNGGALTLIDGHSRRDNYDGEWPTLILDVSDAEADELLLTMDPLAGLAGSDDEQLRSLSESVQFGTPALEDLVAKLQKDSTPELDDGPRTGAPPAAQESAGPPEMELQPFEHYDYIVMLFRSSLDWMQAVEKFGLRKQAFTLRDGEKKKVGLGRVVDGSRVLALLAEDE
jgi:hypothetical protein